MGIWCPFWLWTERQVRLFFRVQYYYTDGVKKWNILWRGSGSKIHERIDWWTQTSISTTILDIVCPFVLRWYWKQRLQVAICVHCGFLLSKESGRLRPSHISFLQYVCSYNETSYSFADLQISAKKLNYLQSVSSIAVVLRPSLHSCTAPSPTKPIFINLVKCHSLWRLASLQLFLTRCEGFIVEKRLDLQYDMNLQDSVSTHEAPLHGSNKIWEVLIFLGMIAKLSTVLFLL